MRITEDTKVTIGGEFFGDCKIEVDNARLEIRGVTITINAANGDKGELNYLTVAIRLETFYKIFGEHLKTFSPLPLIGIPCVPKLAWDRLEINGRLLPEDVSRKN